ncbi:MAG: ABC transporter ATP-binding protein [Vampirovibrionales bacterium]
MSLNRHTTMPSVTLHRLTKTYTTKTTPTLWQYLKQCLPPWGHRARASAVVQTPLKEVSLTLPTGKLIVVVGPSGCGKSTLLRLVAGLETPSSGKVLLDETPVSEIPIQSRGIAMVFQQYALYPHMTVAQHLKFPLYLMGYSSQEQAHRVQYIADVLGLSALLHKKPHQLSGGQRQRVALGRAMVREPKVFLLDEPLSNLDTTLRQHMRHELKALQRKLGVTTLYVTHDPLEALNMGDFLLVLNQGQVEQFASPLEVYLAPKTLFCASFFGDMSYLPAMAHPQEPSVCQVLPDSGHRVSVTLPTGWADAPTTVENDPSESKPLLASLPEGLSPWVIGYRPEWLTLAPYALSNVGQLPFKVERWEYLTGGHWMVYGSLPHEIGTCLEQRVPLTVQVPWHALSTADLQEGNLLGVTLPTQQGVIFDRQSQKRLGTLHAY